MKSITFTCETITPMFLSGADGQTPELRAPSIKGALRFWWRAVNGHLELKELKEKEATIFGSPDDKGGKSLVRINVIQKDLKTEVNNMVPHKNMHQKSFKTEVKLPPKIGQ
jgi:CRISPR-associated protein Cmr1